MLQQVSSQVAALELLHDQLYKDIALIQKSKSLEKANLDLVKLLAAKTADCDELAKPNRDLITDKKSEPQRGSARPDQQATDKRTLVLGSSIIAGLDPQNMNETSTKVKSIRGGHISDVRRHCQSIIGRHSDLVLVIDGNDCRGKVDVDELLNDYDDLIDVAVSKTISNKSVKISSVCLREDSYTLERIDAFNAGLSVLCRDKGCTFIDNDGNFRTRDGSISACVLSDDGVHLTKAGSDLLSRNLGLGVRIPESKPRPALTHNKTNARHSQQRAASGRGMKKREYAPEPRKPHLQQTREPQRNLNQHPISRPNNSDEQPLCDFCGVFGHLSVRCRFRFNVTCHRCQLKGHDANRCLIA